MRVPHEHVIGSETSDSIANAWPGDPRVTERYWYTGHPIDASELIFDAGVGYYPHRNTIDAFAGLTVGRTQYTFRASRHIGKSKVTKVGALSFEVVEEMKRHRLTLAENDSGLSFDLTFDATFPAEEEKRNFHERDGKVGEDMRRIGQFGSWSGWIVANGKRYELKAGTWYGQRDHSFGLRSEMRTDEEKPPVQVHKGFLWTWSMFQFENLAISIFLKERSPDKSFYVSGTEMTKGKDGKVSYRDVTAFHHDITWADDPLGQTIASADFTFEFAEGAPRKIHLEGTNIRFYLKAGMYGGVHGWNHGDDKGESYSEHETWNLDDAKDRKIARTLSDHVVVATTDGQRGIGISEYGVATGYPKYLEPQKHPAM